MSLYRSETGNLRLGHDPVADSGLTLGAMALVSWFL